MQILKKKCWAILTRPPKHIHTHTHVVDKLIQETRQRAPWDRCYEWTISVSVALTPSGSVCPCLCGSERFVVLFLLHRVTVYRAASDFIERTARHYSAGTSLNTLDRLIGVSHVSCLSGGLAQNKTRVHTKWNIFQSVLRKTRWYYQVDSKIYED